MMLMIIIPTNLLGGCFGGGSLYADRLQSVLQFLGVQDNFTGTFYLLIK